MKTQVVIIPIGLNLNEAQIISASQSLPAQDYFVTPTLTLAYSVNPQNGSDLSIDTLTAMFSEITSCLAQ